MTTNSENFLLELVSDKARLQFEKLSLMVNSPIKRLQGTPGNITTRSTTTGRFFYRQYYDDQKKKKDQYIGPASTREGEDSASKMQCLIECEREIARLSKACIQSGLAIASKSVCNSIFQRGIVERFDQGLVLTGGLALSSILNQSGYVVNNSIEKGECKLEFVSLKIGHAFIDGCRHIPPAIAKYMVKNASYQTIIYPGGAIRAVIPSVEAFLLSELHYCNTDSAMQTLTPHHIAVVKALAAALLRDRKDRNSEDDALVPEELRIPAQRYLINPH